MIWIRFAKFVKLTLHQTFLIHSSYGYMHVLVMIMTVYVLIVIMYLESRPMVSNYCNSVLATLGHLRDHV